ncbi:MULTISPECIES: Crp/Fnr family transcriptional regulator [unclassified Spirosoma]|uniref:Crp/Fnr family transcriptional regulator n=1 Tax=unclassified Spirosoma TaxID=2621999 RepID=UPI00095F1756|nr:MULTISPECIES: Crp/Fnr family transcriptional regulator [unclassified Spirosoma]MBN8826008.1 Crp/Fnr family transcriptional regulator [Spirosoma sp.]OJW71035.1 MAG: cyclic nucleotide-binding protein [Spirosoma sp. 48-14]
MNLQPLIDHFESFIPLKDSEKQFLEGRITQRQIRRRQAILQEGFPCQHYTFIVTGCFRMYGVDPKGTEHNIQFAAEQNWIADIGSFHSGKPSSLFIEAIEPAVVLQIGKEDLYFLYTNIPKLDRIFKVIVENNYVELQNRVLQTISSTAQERYLSFLDQYPKLALRLPNTQIASYLGITPEFLSKIRKDLASG